MPLPLWTPAVSANAYRPLLHDALKPLCGNVVIVNWLFQQPWKAYHPNAPRMTPSSFANAQSWSVNHAERNDDGRPSTTFPTSANSVLIPAARTQEGAVLGYIFATGNGADAQSHPFGAIPGIPGLPPQQVYFHGRFLYDAAKSHLLFTLYYPGGDVLALVSFKMVADGCRQRTFMTIPLKEYTVQDFQNPPVVAAISTTEFRTQTMSNDYNGEQSISQSPVAQTYADDSSWSDWTSLWDDMSPSTIAAVVEESLPKRINETQVVSQNRKTDTWDLSGISFAIDELQRDLFGTYYAPDIKLDIASDPMALPTGVGLFTTCMRGQLCAQLGQADKSIQAQLRQHAVQTYYSQGLQLAATSSLNLLPTIPEDTYNGRADVDSNVSFLDDLFKTSQEKLPATSSVSADLDEELILPEVSNPEGDRQFGDDGAEHNVAAEYGRDNVLTNNVTASHRSDSLPVMVHGMKQAGFMQVTRVLEKKKPNLPQSAPRLMPRPTSVGAPHGAQNQETAFLAGHGGTGDIFSEKAAQDSPTTDKKREMDKKRRHRESSAAYYARQRLKLQAQADEIARLKTVKEALMSCKQQLEEDNNAMKALLQQSTEDV